MASLSEFATAVMILMLAGDSAGRDLRPSDHGLLFQNSLPSPANSSLDMRSFFNSSPTSTSSDVSLPRATNSTESLPPSWWRAAGGGGGHWGGALMVASLVCGITGVILLVGSGLLYLFKRRRRKPHLNESFRNNDDDDINVNRLQLVPVISNL